MERLDNSEHGASPPCVGGQVTAGPRSFPISVHLVRTRASPSITSGDRDYFDQSASGSQVAVSERRASERSTHGRHPISIWSVSRQLKQSETQCDVATSRSSSCWREHLVVATEMYHEMGMTYWMGQVTVIFSRNRVGPFVDGWTSELASGLYRPAARRSEGITPKRRRTMR
jgi:hypothetical protein